MTTAVIRPVGHDHALDLAAAAPAFRLTEAEHRELRDHLRACPDCARRAARLRTDLDAIGRLDPPVSPRLHDRIREIAVTQPRSGPRPFGVILVLGLLALGVVGASAGIVALGGPRLAGPAAPAVPVLQADPDDQVDWRTEVVALAARELLIAADGRTFHGVGQPALVSDPGDPTRWTLEATWQEQGREQRLHLYFSADDAAWWVDDVRVYDGSATPKWATFQVPEGGLLRTPLGEAFSGDLNLAGTSATGPVRLHLAGLRIAVRPQDNVAEPMGGVRKVLKENGNPAVDGDPFKPGGPLHCSGILQLTPQAAEARLQLEGFALSWRWQTATGTNTGFSEPRDRAPSTGWITDTAVGMNGELIVFVADPVKPFGGPRREPPQDCAAP